jgi:2-dehydropantoate 2-reductase
VGQSFAVVGAGAIGAYVGAALARGGSTVTLVARGAHLAAMQRDGVRVISERGDFTAHPRAVGSIAEVGPVDVVILALKAQQIAAIAPELRALNHDRTAIVAMQNGIPWWYFQRHGGPYDGRTVEAVDPGGVLARTIDPARVIGCVIYSSTEIVEPGVIRHLEGTRYSLGEPDRSVSDRVQAIAADFVAGGLKAPVESDIRKDIWVKLLGNAAFNPISALTRATLVAMAEDPGVHALVAEMMAESIAVAERLGSPVDIAIEKRIEGARRVGEHKTSMLQDLDARKAFELDALVGAVVELGALVGIPTPATAHVYALAHLLDRTNRAG